jgi:acyl-CoA synthetase (AMP-forming)/AMP-acid ligase II
MSSSVESNFAARLLSRLTENSDLVDAATGMTISGTEVPALIAGAAAGFAAAGLRPGDRIVIACRISPASTLAYLGALYAGLTAVPVNERALSTSGTAMLRSIGTRAVWTEQSSGCDWAVREGWLHLTGSFPSRSPGAVAPAAMHADDLAALMPTSGSTGLPRLVEVSHGNLTANTEAIIRSQRLVPGDRAMLILPVSYCFGASVMHTHLYQGGAVVFDSRFMFPDKVLQAIERYSCTSFAGVPTAYNILLRRSNIQAFPLKSLRRCLQAGGALGPERIRRMRQIIPHAEFFVMYGQTEATARICCLPPDRLEEKLGSVGVPLDNLRVRVVDEAGRDSATGQMGEIWVSGSSICRGYFNEPAETARKFRDGWLLTGDIGYLDADGYLWLVGRKSEFIKMRGIRVSLVEIENRMAALPGVCECAASAVEHPEAGEALALYVVPEEGARDVIASIRRQMPSEWICNSVSLVAALPRNLHGKLVRASLAGLARARSASDTSTSGESPVAQRL